ncbi:MAG: hypothetical protein WC908_00130 [Candidatus Paceibacterota bacterium]
MCKNCWIFEIPPFLPSEKRKRIDYEKKLRAEILNALPNGVSAKFATPDELLDMVTAVKPTEIVFKTNINEGKITILKNLIARKVPHPVKLNWEHREAEHVVPA